MHAGEEINLNIIMLHPTLLSYHRLPHCFILYLSIDSYLHVAEPVSEGTMYPSALANAACSVGISAYSDGTASTSYYFHFFKFILCYSFHSPLSGRFTLCFARFPRTSPLSLLLPTFPPTPPAPASASSSYSSKAMSLCPPSEASRMYSSSSAIIYMIRAS